MQSSWISFGRIVTRITIVEFTKFRLINYVRSASSASLVVEIRQVHAMDGDTAPVVFWPIGVYFLAVLGVVSSMVIGSYLLGSKNRNRKNIQPYESGIASTGSARVRLSADFYLFAMFFVIFDLESVFSYSWAIAVRELGWIAYGQVLFFVGALASSLIYLWRVGALESKR